MGSENEEWERCDEDSAWEICDDEDDSMQAAATAVKTGSCQAAADLRISPEDGKVYTFEEFQRSCEGSYNLEEIAHYWSKECSPLHDHPVGRFILETMGLNTIGEAHVDLCDGALGAGMRWWHSLGSHQCSASTSERLLCNLCLSGIVRQEDVLEAMLKVDRRNYVPDREEAYADAPQLLGPHATISAPHMHGQCLELLAGHIKPGAVILDIGCGSGYLSAVMARMVNRHGYRGKVIGVDHLEYLVELSEKNVSKADADLLAANGPLKFLQADGWLGCIEHAPFDVIHVGAAAESVPQELRRQLKRGGRLLLPVGGMHPDSQQHLMVVDHLLDGSFTEQRLCGVRFVPLVNVGGRSPDGKQIGSAAAAALDSTHWVGASSALQATRETEVFENVS